jgi:acyl dehydratase
MTKVLNQGCRIRVNQALPAGEPLRLTARLEDVREEPRKARIHTRLTTGTASAPDAVVADVFAVVPLPSRDGEGGTGKGKRQRAPRPGIPLTATEITRRHFSTRAGRDFAFLTGDLNPIHWLRVAARAAGFKNTILHGFATLGWAWEGLLAHRLSGNDSRVGALEVRFVRPLVLPADVGLYVWDDDGEIPRPTDLSDAFVGIRIAVASAPGAPPFMAGTAWVRHRA